MGDARYEKHLRHVLEHGLGSLGQLTDEQLIQALAALAARRSDQDAYTANVLASEIMNRLARVHAAVMHSADGLLAIDLEGTTLFANPAAETLLGWTGHELRGMHFHTMVHEEKPTIACELRNGIERGTGRGRVTLTRKDGVLTEVDYSIATVEREGDRHGAVMAFHAPRWPPTG